MSWSCLDCLTVNADDVEVCQICGGPRGQVEESATAPIDDAAPGGSKHGWRMTLPNYTVVPLPVTGRALVVGRSSEGPIGRVLQLFEHVSKSHVTLEVHEDSLTILPSDAVTNPTFLFPDTRVADDPALSQPPDVLPRRLSLGVEDSAVLCLGQCCFVRIDRGEA